jgi:omega-6 fatty acid desaturase (delta-12 desaturase)
LFTGHFNPFVLFTIGPLFVILVQNRIPKKQMSRNEKWNVYFTNLMIMVMAFAVSLLIGFKAFLLIQVPVIVLSHCLGLWLFYVQHQFDEVSWERQETWDYKNAAMKEFLLKLPVILQWFTGIGFHHVHHLSSKIQLLLSRCHYKTISSRVNPIGMVSAFKAFKLNLWDENSADD